MERTNLRDFLAREAIGQAISFVPNPGNAGDALTATATMQLFRSLGIDAKWVDPKALPPAGATVFYGAGGALMPPYEFACERIRGLLGRADRLVILPQTLAGHEALLRELGPKVTLFCRETESLAHASRWASGARLLLADDPSTELVLSAALSTGLPGLLPG